MVNADNGHQGNKRFSSGLVSSAKLGLVANTLQRVDLFAGRKACAREWTLWITSDHSGSSGLKSWSVHTQYFRVRSLNTKFVYLHCQRVSKILQLFFVCAWITIMKGKDQDVFFLSPHLPPNPNLPTPSPLFNVSFLLFIPMILLFYSVLILLSWSFSCAGLALYSYFFLSLD